MWSWTVVKEVEWRRKERVISKIGGPTIQSSIDKIEIFFNRACLIFILPINVHNKNNVKIEAS